MAAIIGRKLGMTQIFTEDGIRVAVTVVEAGPCPVTQVKTEETDGYEAVQLGFGAVRHVADYILAGAVIVVPIWLLMRLFGTRKA